MIIIYSTKLFTIAIVTKSLKKPKCGLQRVIKLRRAENWNVCDFVSAIVCEN